MRHRLTAASYIASFVARAKFLPSHHVRSVIRLLCRWLSEFIDKRSRECSGPDVSRWGHFYGVCQAVMYIFCFRWRELKEETEDEFGVVEERWTEGLQVMETVVNSKFNPLKVCSLEVVEMFAKVAKHLQLVYCYSKIDQNKRGGLIREGEMLESYFPFDPYGLPIANRWIKDCFVEWQSIPGLEDEDEDSSEDDEDDVTVNGDDEDISDSEDDD